MPFEFLLTTQQKKGSAPLTSLVVRVAHVVDIAADEAYAIYPRHATV